MIPSLPDIFVAIEKSFMSIKKGSSGRRHQKNNSNTASSSTSHRSAPNSQRPSRETVESLVCSSYADDEINVLTATASAVAAAAAEDAALARGSRKKKNSSITTTITTTATTSSSSPSSTSSSSSTSAAHIESDNDCDDADCGRLISSAASFLTIATTGRVGVCAATAASASTRRALIRRHSSFSGALPSRNANRAAFYSLFHNHYQQQRFRTYFDSPQRVADHLHRASVPCDEPVPASSSTAHTNTNNNNYNKINGTTTAKTPTPTLNGTSNSQETLKPTPTPQNNSTCNTATTATTDTHHMNISHNYLIMDYNSTDVLPPPPIECSSKLNRRPPLTICEYNDVYCLGNKSNAELIERVYLGGCNSNQLRRSLWPLIFKLIEHRDTFEFDDKMCAYVTIEHEENVAKWSKLETKFQHYLNQWQAILPEQEIRFSSFRERKCLIERDVPRSDRQHPFYSNESINLEHLKTLLMTYMMYDFDIGYVQGMSDLAAPILYVFDGNLVKSFWVFVEIMKLLRRNFEFSQKTVHFQLCCLFKLIKITDTKFANYLKENDCGNCFFAFRLIMCLFKRELMKDDEEDYGKVLQFWDTIWCVQTRHEYQTRDKFTHKYTVTSTGVNGRAKGDIDDNDEPPAKLSNRFSNRKNSTTNNANRNITKKSREKQQQEQIVAYTKETFYSSFDPNQADVPRFSLTETEKFVIASSLAIIRRERSKIVSRHLDASEIHLHFMDPKLGADLERFIESATNIYQFLNTDFQLHRLLANNEQLNGVGAGIDDDELPFGEPASKDSTVDPYDLLSDYSIISASSGNLNSYMLKH